MDCYCDYDPADVYRATIRRARKAHECEECGGLIEPGCRYEYVEGLWDHHWTAFKTCANCTDLRDYLLAHIPCGCWSHGNMLDDCDQEADNCRGELEGTGAWFGYLRRRVKTTNRL